MLHPIRFVLVRPDRAGNVGATARALKNMGFSDLWLVDPRDPDSPEDVRMACGAEDVLEKARRVPVLAKALAGCTWSVGATRRTGRRRTAVWSPRTLAQAVRKDPERRPLALVFGPEKDGLAADDLRSCQDLVRIPTADAHPSLNLAQAVLILAYELAETPHAPKHTGATARQEATFEELAGLYEHLETILLEIEFIRPDTAPHRMRAIRNILGRSRLGPGDVRLLRGICRQMLWAVHRGSGGRLTRPGPPPILRT